MQWYENITDRRMLHGIEYFSRARATASQRAFAHERAQAHRTPSEFNPRTAAGINAPRTSPEISRTQRPAVLIQSQPFFCFGSPLLAHRGCFFFERRLERRTLAPRDRAPVRAMDPFFAPLSRSDHDIAFVRE